MPPGAAIPEIKIRRGQGEIPLDVDDPPAKLVHH